MFTDSVQPFWLLATKVKFTREVDLTCLNLLFDLIGHALTFPLLFEIVYWFAVRFDNCRYRDGMKREFRVKQASRQIVDLAIRRVLRSLFIRWQIQSSDELKLIGSCTRNCNSAIRLSANLFATVPNVSGAGRPDNQDKPVDLPVDSIS